MNDHDSSPQRPSGAVGSSFSVTSMTHNDLGQIAQSSRQAGGLTYSFTYTYNLNGTPTSITYPSGRIVTYTYDDAGGSRASRGLPPDKRPPAGC